MNIASQVSTPRPSRNQATDLRRRVSTPQLDHPVPPEARPRTTPGRALSWIGLALLWALAAVLLVLGVELAGALAG